MIKGEKKALNNLDNLPKKEGMRVRIIKNHEELGHKGPEHITLSKWLNAKVGQKWSEVYSDLKKWAKKQGIRVNHCQEYRDANSYNISHYVIENCTIKQGKVYDTKGELVESFGKYNEFYVGPDGIMWAAPCHKVRYKRVKPIFYWKDKRALIQWKFIEDIWYECKLEKVDLRKRVHSKWRDLMGVWNKYSYIKPYWDDKAFGQITKDHMEKYWGGHYVCVSKLQCNSKEIKRLKAIHNL